MVAQVMALGVTRAHPTHTRMSLARQLVVLALQIALLLLVVSLIQHVNVIQATKDQMEGLVSSAKLENIDHLVWLNALPVHFIRHPSLPVMSLGIASV